MLNTMILVSGTIMQYFLVSPVYFSLLDEVYGVAVTEVTSPEGVAFLPNAYWIFYYAYPSLTVALIIAEVLLLYFYAQRRYYASDVGVYA
jgi:hypothetical protein